MPPHRTNSDGLPQYHLRRIGRRASLPDIANLIDFRKRVTLIGRNGDVVDYVLSAAKESRRRTISKTHARIIRSLQNNQHRLVDSSFSGVYINDCRIDSDVILKEGDTVTFGHPQGSQVDRGERVRQPNSEFYFMFELCDCEQEGSNGLRQDPGASSHLQSSMFVPASCQRLPMPQCFLGMFPGFLQGVRWPVDVADAGVRHAMALHDSGGCPLVSGAPHPTYPRPELAPPRMMYFPDRQLAPEISGSTSLLTGVSHGLVVPLVPPGSTSQYSASAVAEGSQSGWLTNSQITHCGSYLQPVDSGKFDHPTCPGPGEHSNRPLPESRTQTTPPPGEAPPPLEERPGSKVHPSTFQGNKLALVSLGQMGWRSEDATVATTAQPLTPMPCFHQDSAKRGSWSESVRGYRTSTHTHLTMDQTTSVKGDSTGLTAAGSVTLAGSTNQPSQRDVQEGSPSMGEHGTEAAVGMEWAPSMLDATAAVCMEPQLDSDTVVENIDSERTETELRMQDGALTEEVQEALDVVRGGVTPTDTMPTLSNSCWDSVESQCHLLSDDSCLRQSELTESMEESETLHSCAAKQPDHTSKWNVENEEIQSVPNEIGSAERPVQTVIPHSVTADGSFIDFKPVESNSVSGGGLTCGHTGRILHKPIDDPRNDNLDKNIPASDLLCQDRDGNTMTACVGDENMGSPGEHGGSGLPQSVNGAGPLSVTGKSRGSEEPAMAGESPVARQWVDDDLLRKDVNCDRSETVGAEGKSASDPGVQPVECELAARVSNVQIPSCSGMESDLSSNGQSQDISSRCPPVSKATLDADSTTEHLSSSDNTFVFDKPHLLGTLGLRLEASDASPGETTGQMGKGGRLVDPELSDTDSKSAVTGKVEVPDVDGLSVASKAAEDSTIQTEGWSAKICNPALADCPPSPISLSNDDGSAYSAGIEPEALLFIKAARSVCSIPVSACSPTDHSASELANSVNLPSLDPGKGSCCSIVELGHSNQAGPQGGVSAAGQLCEGEWPSTEHGETTGDIRGCVIQGNTPEISKPEGVVTFMEGVEMQCERDSIDQSELDATDQTCESHDGRLNLLECKEFPSIPIGSVDVNVETVGGHTLNTGMVKEGYLHGNSSGVVETSETLVSTLEDNSMEIGDTVGSDEDMDVDSVSRSVARDEIVESDLSNTCPAPSELQLTSARVIVTEAGNCGAEGEVDESPLSERSPVAPPLGDVEREEELEGSEPLMPVREPANQFGLEVAETLVARQLGIGVAHVPSCTVTPANYDTLCPLMQSETLNSTAEKETINQSHCKHSAMNVPSSDDRVLSSLEFQAEAASSENLLEAAMVTPDRDNLDPSQDESHPEPGVTDEPLALSETGQDQPRLDHVEGEGHLTSGFLTTDVQSELLSESCNHFTNTVTTKIVGHFPGEERVNLSPVMDSEIDRPGPHLLVGNGKFETTKSPIQYCPPVRPMALTSCPVAEAGESPESPARTVPLSPSTMGATWHGGRDSPVTHGCQEGAPMSENAAEIRDEFRDSGETADAPSADSTEEPSRKKVRACTGSTRDCESSVCNPSLLGEASATAAAAHFGVTTLTELSVTTNNSVLLSESVSVQRSDLTSSVPDAWPVTQEAYPTVDTACGSESELSGGNDQAAGWHDEPLCLGAADTDQFEQAVPHAHDEVPEVGLSGTEGTERTQFLLVHGGKAEAVDGVEGELVQPSFSDSQRIELEDPVEEQSEDENIAEELMLRPATPENRELQSHSPLVKELNLTGRELPMSLGLCRGAEEEESTVTGVLGDDANCCSMEETQLTGREGAEGEEDEICSDEHAVQPELTPGRAQVSVCQEEGLVWITAAPRIQPQLFTAAVPPRPGGRETGGVGQKQLKAGEQPTPASSEKDVLLEEKSGEMARSRISEEPAGLLELCVGVCRAREQAGSPTASPSPDTRQQCVQYDLEMDSSKRENPKAGRETGLLDKVSGEGSIPVSQFPETLDSYGLEGEEESSEQSASGHVTPCEPMERNDLSEQTASEEGEASYPEQLTCTQLPGTLSDSALATVENAEELNIITGKANLNVSPPSPDCTDVGEVNLSLPTSIRNKGDPVQTSRTVTPCTCVSEDERISEDICRPTGFSEESMVFGEEGAEDLELDDEQLERKHHSHLPPGHREQQFIFSKEAEDQSAGEGMPRRGVAQIVQGTLGELGLCTQRETVPQTLSILQNGVVPTHSDCATNVSECKDSRARSQQGAEVQKPSDGILKKCCPKNRGVEQETETVALGERGQFQQEENVAQPSLLSEEHGAVLPQTLDRIPFGETPIQSPVSPNPEAESVHIEWQDMGRDGMGKCQVIVGSTDLAETGAADISRTDGVVKVSSTIVSSDPKYLNLQPSEPQLKREDITSKSLNSQMNLNSRPSKRPCEGEEALGSKSTASSPSKRVCLPQQAGTEGLASAEGQNVTLLSLSAEQRQHQAWYIGRLVQQFVTEYRASQECRVTGEVRAVSKQDEVRRIVREFFKTQVAKSEEPIVDLPQQSVEMGDSDQCHRSENSEPRQEPRETSDDKSPCLMGSSSDCGPGTNGSGSSTSTEPLPLLSRPSSELVNWHVGARGDSESSLEEAGKLARKTGTVQETAQGDTFHVMSPGPSNCVPGDTDPMQEVTVAEGAHPSLSLTEESGTNVEAFDASRVSWSSLAHRSPNADSHEGLENGGLGAWESQATPAGSDGTAVTASNKMGSSLLEILRTATGSLSCAVLECDGEAETDSGSAALADGSADQGVADVTGGCCSHSSSTDKSPPPSPALSTSPEANSPGQPGEMRCLSLAEPSSPGDSSNCSQDVIESCNPMESPPSSHNNPGYSYNVGERRVNVDGVESDPPPHPPPLRISEVWSIQSCSSGEGHFPALDPAPSHFTELLPNTKGGCTWKPEHECPTGLSGPPEGEASSAAKVSGLGSDMLSSNGQQGEAEAFCLGFTSDRSPRLETEPSKRVVAQNIDMRDADHSSSSLVWRGDLHREGDIIIPTSIQEAGSELGTKPYLELLEDPVTSQNDIGIRRLRADFLGSSKEETGTDRKRTSLATNQISSVGCVEGRTEEGGSALCMDHDAKPVLGLLPAPTERAVSPQHDATDERESQEFGEETSVCGCSVVSKRLREVSPPQGVPLVNRLSLRAKKRIRTSSDGANDTADPSLSRSPPRPGLSRTPSPPRPGLSRTPPPPRPGLSRSPSPSRPGLSQSPSQPGLSQSPSRPGLSQSPSRPGLSQSPSRPGLSQSPSRPGLSQSPSRPGLSQSPSRPGLSQSPSRPGLSQSPSRPGLSQSPSRPGLSQSPSRPGLSQSPSRPGLSQSPSRPGLSQSPSRPGLSQSPSRPGLSQSPSRPGLSQSPSRPGLSQSPSANDERAVISSVIVISDTEDEPLLCTIKEESESDEEAPGRSSGHGAGGVTAAASGFLFSRSAGGSMYPQRGAGIEGPGGASCYRGAPRPSLAESCPMPVALSLSSVLVPSSPAVLTRSLIESCLDHDSRCLQESKHSGSMGMECHVVLPHCEEHRAGFPRQQNSRSPPIAMLHSSRQRSIPPLLTKPQIDPFKPQVQANPPDAQNISLPVQLPLPYSFDDDIFPPPELDYLPDSLESSDREESWDSSTKFRMPSANTLGSDFVHLGDRRISDLSPQDSTCLTPECSSDGNCVGSVFLEDQDEQNRASDPSATDAAAFRPSPRGLLESSWAMSDQDVISQLRECELLLQSVSQTLKVDGIEEAHAKEWKKQIEEMQGQTVPPQTYIAVIGDTGSGKSSLLNALLDEEAVLPTSAMRACTAVAVEVSHNAQNDHYCAEVEFFTEEEWDKELQLLLRDMSDKNGRLKKRRPDPNSEASVAYSRVRAVYGKILPYSELKQIQDVTSHLGRTEIISEAKAMDFLRKVQNFIDSRADDSRTCRGGEFWPIVKRVKVWVPRSPVLRTGAVLVDLPGIRDSNAARNNIAKEYLKNCHAVWIVANVTRAVDDKTARDMLDKNLHRQLFLDGQYGRLAFICTKTDSHNVTEILSALRLTSNCTSLEDEIAELKSHIEQKRTELQAWRLDLERVRVCSQVKERNAKAKLLGLAIKQQESELNDLQYKMSIKRRELSLNSIKARNIFCRKNIRLNIKCRLQEMKRQARKKRLESEEESEEGSDADDDEEDDCDDDIQPVLTGEIEPVSDRNGNLPVFTVSSTEYLKLQDKLLRDGPAQVFNNIEDTEIPAVQRFVHQITLSRRVVATEMVIRRVATFVSQVVTYLTNRRAQDASYQAQVRGTVRECLFQVKELFQNTAEDCNREVGISFSLITTQLKLGKSLAVTHCEHSVHKWGLRPPNGYPYPTYRAACERNGSFTSPACGPVDFNEELTYPMLTLLLEVWDEVFSESVLRSKSLLHHLHKFKAAVQENLQRFFSDLKERLRQIEGDTQPVDYILSQHIPAVEAKLQNFILMLMMDITTHQRGITRILTPSVQEEMIPAYQACQSETGSGSFTRMKSHMEQYVRKHRDHIFSIASQKLTSELSLLQDAICSGLKHILEEIHTELCVQFEPMLKPVRIIDEIIPRLVSVCARVSVLCQKSHIDFAMPKIEDSEEETGPTMCPTQPIKEESPSLQELRMFLGKAKMMKIGQFNASPTDSVKISLDEVFLSFEVSGFSKQIVMPFQSLAACDYCPDMHFFILYPGRPRSGFSEERSRWDVLVILDEQQTAPGFGEWMDAVCSQTRGSTEFRKLELHHGVERLHSLGVTFQGTDIEAPEQDVRTQTGPKPAFHLASSFVNVSQQTRKRQWNDDVIEINRFTVSPSLLCPSHWSMASYEAQTETQPPVLKKENTQEQGSGFSQDWIDRSQPPVLKQERLEKTKSVEFENH